MPLLGEARPFATHTYEKPISHEWANLRLLPEKFAGPVQLGSLVRPRRSGLGGDSAAGRTAGRASREIAVMNHPVDLRRVSY